MSENLKIYFAQAGLGEGGADGVPQQSGEGSGYITVNVEELQSEGCTEEMIETSLQDKAASSIADKQSQADGSFAPVLAGLLAGVLCFLAIRNHMRRK